jgi:hypothetical protein
MGVEARPTRANRGQTIKYLATFLGDQAVDQAA